MAHSEKFDINEVILAAHKHSYQIALETAVRTGTSLIVSRNGKIVKIKPPYEFKLVPLKSSKKKKAKK